MYDKATIWLTKNYFAVRPIPWSIGYRGYRKHFISQALANPELMSKFRQFQPLPPDYGFALDERCVEYPWLFAQLDTQPECILDAGSILNNKFLLEQPIWQQKKLHILTLAPEKQCHWNRCISYLFEDLRHIPIQDNYYDTVACISTLEHIGLDNRQFTSADSYEENAPTDFLLAVREMRRVLKPSGHLLLTVPFGKYQNIGTQQVFNENLLEQTIAAFEPGEVTRTFFSYTKDGWQFADVSECKECEYVDWIMLPTEQRSAQFPMQPDGATAARAVACVKLQKPK